MQKKWIVCLLVACMMISILAGCMTKPAAEPEAEEVQSAPEIDEGITVAGTVITAAGKSIDLLEKNEYVRRITACHWLEKNKIAVECAVQGYKSQPLYLAVYDVVRDCYVYEQYGKQFVWQNDDLDTLIYVVDYADEGEPSQVLNRKNVVLYESDVQEQITAISYVPKGIKVELADLEGNNQRQVIVESAS